MYVPHLFIAALFTIAEIWELPRCLLIGEWIKKMCMCTMEYCTAIKKNELLPFAATWIDLEGIILSEINQAEEDKYCMVSITCGT